MARQRTRHTGFAISMRTAAQAVDKVRLVGAPPLQRRLGSVWGKSWTSSEVDTALGAKSKIGDRGFSFLEGIDENSNIWPLGFLKGCCYEHVHWSRYRCDHSVVHDGSAGTGISDVHGRNRRNRRRCVGSCAGLHCLLRGLPRPNRFPSSWNHRYFNNHLVRIVCLSAPHSDRHGRLDRPTDWCNNLLCDLLETPSFGQLVRSRKQLVLFLHVLFRSLSVP